MAETNGHQGNDIISLTTLPGKNQEDFQVRGAGGDDTLITSYGNDTVNGGSGNDTLDGGGGNDSLSGEDGNDSLLPGAGNDRLTGGPGNDDFVFGPDDDSDTITDFNPGTGDTLIDLIVLEGASPGVIDDMVANVKQNSDGAVVTFGNTSITLVGFAPDDVTTDFFIS